MNQETHLADGAIHLLNDILQRTAPKGIFLVHDKSAYALSGAEAILTEIFQPYSINCFYEFEYNPKIEDVERGLELFQQRNYDLVIAVGGGSVLDMANLIRIMAVQDASPSDIVTQHKSIEYKGVPMVAIPTTAGSGSEATHFAVVYLDKIKYSVAHEYMLPDIAIIDPELTYSMPPKLTAVTGIDALSQAIESYWSVNSTDESKAYAREAIELVMQNLERSVHKPSPETRYAMSQAANLAGQAINISKTTAPHALSYTITSYFGVPHGHAVGLPLGEFLIYNARVSNRDITDSRGMEYVRRTISEINHLLGTHSATASREKISGLMERIGVGTRLCKLGIDGEANRNLIADSMNFERVVNNPRKVTKNAVVEILSRIE